MMIKFEYLQMTLDTDSVTVLNRELALNGWMLQSREDTDYTTTVTFTRPVFVRPVVSVFDNSEPDDYMVTEVPSIREMQAMDDDTKFYTKDVA